MAVSTLADRQYAAPAAAANVTLTPPGSSWGNSAWVTLLASTPSACVLTGIVLATNWGDGSSVANSWEVDVGTGAAGSEGVIATVKGVIRGIFGQYGDPELWIPTGIGIDNIASGVRLAARIRIDSTNTTTWSCAATYVRKPLTGTALTTAQPLLPLPAAGAAVTVTAHATAWLSGTWVQIRSASGAALVIVTVIFDQTSSNVEYELDLGTGGAGSEVVITTLRQVGVGDMAVFGLLPLRVPLDNVAASTRIAARIRASTGSAAGRVALSVIEKPL
jgi:hypothetical protein